MINYEKELEENQPQAGGSESSKSSQNSWVSTEVGTSFRVQIRRKTVGKTKST